VVRAVATYSPFAQDAKQIVLAVSCALTAVEIYTIFPGSLREKINNGQRTLRFTDRGGDTKDPDVAAVARRI